MGASTSKTMARDIAADEPPAIPTVQELRALDKRPVIHSVQELRGPDKPHAVCTVQELCAGDAPSAIGRAPDLCADDADLAAHERVRSSRAHAMSIFSFVCGVPLRFPSVQLSAMNRTVECVGSLVKFLCRSCGGWAAGG
ncbi:hypothetical protein ACQJBY_071527 [Aegilops geniculata]